MRGDLKHIFAWLRALPHPPKAALIASLDGELEARRHAKIESHLERCPLCRSHLENIQEGLRFFDRSSASGELQFSVEEGLEKIISTIQSSARLSGPHSVLQKTSPVYAKLSSELSIYLGSHAATQLLERCSDSPSEREGLNETLAPVVVAFLGQHTGAAVLANVLQIWDQSHEVAS